jgi:thiol-disulfide isomerase/thioredoxin
MSRGGFATFVLFVAAFLGLNATPSVGAASEPEFVLLPEGFVAAFPAVSKGASRYTLPRAVIYNADGLAIGIVGGYSNQLTAVLDKFFAASKPTTNYATLPTMLKLVKDGTSGASKRRQIMNARHVILEFSADWCAPCHVMLADLVKYAKARPELGIVLAVVEADMPGRPDEEQNKIREAMGIPPVDTKERQVVKPKGTIKIK